MENAVEHQAHSPSPKTDKMNILIVLIAVLVVVSLINSYAIFSKGGSTTGNVISEGKNATQGAQAPSTATAPKAAAPAAPAPALTKSDKPEVEVFVMSYCPYGTQIEKGIIPVVELLKDKIDFTLKFVSYAMHGQKEIDENTLQYCLQKEQTAKLIPYMNCFLQAGDSAGCLKSSAIDTEKLDACVKAADTEFSISKNFADNSTWLSGRYPKYDVYAAENTKYGVRGSPTLVINGAQASSARDPASLLKVICSAFNKEPSECSQTLSSSAPSAGFGTAAAAPAGGGCGG
jgi:glutaredoxin